MYDIRQHLFFDIFKLIAPAGYCNAGFPNYNTLFGRDSLIAAWQLLPLRPDIAQATLRILARYQAHRTDAHKDSEPGKILHEYRFEKGLQKEIPNWGWPYYGSVDATSLFLIVLEEYVKRTADHALLEELWPAARAAMRWHLARSAEHPDGFIAYQRKNPHGLFHQGWKDSFEDHLGIVPPVAIIEEQGYAYRAAHAFARLAQNLPHDKNLAQRGLLMARRIQESTMKKLWMPWRDYFALGLGRDGVENRAITSNPGHLLLADDFLDEEIADKVVKRLFADDMWTIGGIRTLSADDPNFDAFSYHCGSVWPHDNWMIYKGLVIRGYEHEARKLAGALCRPYYVFGHEPELFAVTKGVMGETILPIDCIAQLELHNKIEGRHLRSIGANELQAWSAGALLNILMDAENF